MSQGKHKLKRTTRREKSKTAEGSLKKISKDPRRGKIEKVELANFEQQAYDRSNTIVTAMRYLEYLLVEK